VYVPIRAARRGDQTHGMLREEIDRLTDWEERHRRLLARVLVALALTVVVDAVGTVLTWRFESGVRGGDVHGLGDALFF
jgi:hypothetical protein